METTRALRASGIDDMVAKFRMSAVDSAVKLAIENNSAANSRTDGTIDQPRSIAARSPSNFRERGSISIVLQHHVHIKNRGQIAHRSLPTPAGQEIHIAKLAAHGIHRPCRSDPNASQLDFGSLRSLARRVPDQFDSIGIAVRIGRRFHPGKHLTFVIDHADRDFRSPQY
jgi:hypothetical protein